MKRPIPGLISLLVALLAFVGLAGSASAARLYLPQYASGGSGEADTIVGVETGADGSMTPLPGSPFPSTGAPPAVEFVSGLAFAPDGSHAAAGFLDQGVQGYSVPEGALTPAGAAVTGGGTTSIAVSPDGRFAYAPTRAGGSGHGVRVYAIGPDGALTAEGSTGTFVSYDLALTPDGRFAFAETTAETIEVFAVQADGSLAPVGSTPLTDYPLKLQVSPDGRFLYVLEDAGPAEYIFSFTIGIDGSLTENGSPVAEGVHDYFALSPDGEHLYAPNYLASGVDVLAVGADGSLTVTGSLEAEDAESVAVSPDGRYLYISTGDAIEVAAIAADGSLTLLPYSVPVLTGEATRLVFQPLPTPRASFTATAGAPGTATAFDAAGSERAVRYDWDFGDGTTTAAGGPTPTHVYAAAGTYTVTLTVTDANGCSTHQVYTGQSTVCPGGEAATTSATVTVAAPGDSDGSGGGQGKSGGRPAKSGDGPTSAPTASAGPVLTHLKLIPRRFRVDAPAHARGHRSRVGTVIHFRLSEAGKVRLTFEHRLPGRRVGGKCGKPRQANAKHKPCPRFVKLGARTIRRQAGAARFRFSGRLHGEPLTPGAYRVTAVVIDTAGHRSKPAHAGFEVIG